MRIGQGYDVHRLVKDRKLILGGVLINNTFGLLGHSDADVLTHAIMDAILGAASLGDIGKIFPDNQEEYKDISSLLLLDRCIELLNKNGYKIINIDSTIIAQSPKLSPYLLEMRENISKICHINILDINIKATTEEGLGFTGNREGIAAQAVCLIDNK